MNSPSFKIVSEVLIFIVTDRHLGGFQFIREHYDVFCFILDVLIFLCWDSNSGPPACWASTLLLSSISSPCDEFLHIHFLSLHFKMRKCQTRSGTFLNFDTVLPCKKLQLFLVMTVLYDDFCFPLFASFFTAFCFDFHLLNSFIEQFSRFLYASCIQL